MELVLELPCHRCGKKIDGFKFIISYLYLVNLNVQNMTILIISEYIEGVIIMNFGVKKQLWL